MNEVFDNSVELKNKSDEIERLLCSDSGKEFITDVYESFEFDKFKTIVRTTTYRGRVTTRFVDFTAHSIETRSSGEQNSVDPDQHGVQANSQGPKCELNVRREARQRFRGVSGRAGRPRGKILGLERFPSQRRLDESFRGDAISRQERYVSALVERASLHLSESRDNCRQVIVDKASKSQRR